MLQKEQYIELNDDMMALLGNSQHCAKGKPIRQVRCN